MEKLLKSVLERITPSEEEEHAIMAQVTRLESIAREIMPENTKIVLVGSLAKGTWLKGATDIDLFFLFEPGFDLEEAMPLLHKIADKLNGERELLYAQHPYLHVHFDGFEADLVPGYNVPPTAILSAVDRSPYHTEFVRENLVSVDDVRLLKKFAKGIGVYGADMVHEGFSGYLCELLVIRYGSFLEVLRAAAGWETPVVLDEMDSSDAFVMKDPVDANRNVAAAVSARTLKRFIRASRDFLKSHSEKFFFQAELPEVDLKSVPGLIVVGIEHDPASEDIIASQIRCLMLRCVEKLNRYGFHVQRYGMLDGAFALILEVTELPEEYVHLGPPLKFKENAETFREKWENAYEEDGRLKAKAKRRFTKAKDYLKHLLENLPNHITSAELVQPTGKLKRKVAVFVEDIPPWRY